MTRQTSAIFVVILVILTFALPGSCAWHKVLSPDDEDLFDVWPFDSLHAIIVGSDEFAAKTTDGGVNWEEMDVDAGDELRTVCFTDRLHGWIGGGKITQRTSGGGMGVGGPGGVAPVMVGSTSYDEEGAIVATVDGGRSWFTQIEEDDIFVSKIVMFGRSRGIAVGGNEAILVTNDAGKTWEKKEFSTLERSGGVSISSGPVGVALGGNSGTVKNLWCSNNGLCYGVGPSAAIIATPDFGRSWMRLPPATPEQKDLNSVAFADRSQGIIVAEDGIICRTSDGGEHWRMDSLGTENLNDIAFVDAEHGYIVGENGLILSTSDAGRTWKKVFEDPERGDLNAISVAPDGSVWAVGDDGLIVRSITSYRPARVPVRVAETAELEPDVVEIDDEDVDCLTECGPGMVCRMGVCVSRCNPPCDDGEECGSDGVCRRTADMALTSRAEEISSLGEMVRVYDRSRVVQGVLLLSDCAGTMFTIDDSTFGPAQSLYINLPPGKHRMAARMPGRHVWWQTCELASGQVRQFEVRMRVAKMVLAPSGGFSIPGGAGLMHFNFDGGLQLSKNEVGVNLLLGMGSGQRSLDTLIVPPDNQKAVVDTTFILYGIGCYYAYCGFAWPRVSVIPRVAVGIYGLDAEPSLNYVDASYFPDDSDSLPSRSWPLYAAPGLEVRVRPGSPSLNIRAKAEVFIGPGRVVASLSAGVAFVFPN